jgi:DeoR/GlpR family transcriptional regulator of sugar metabolism
MIQRHERILAMLADKEKASVGALAKAFGVTGMTIRRDLDALEREGRVVRTHGGAVLSQTSVVEFSFQGRSQAHAKEKFAIAQEAVKLIKPGMTVSMDTGTTMLEVARALAGAEKVTVLTSSLAIASALYARDGIKLVLLGGVARKGSPDLQGDLTQENLTRFRVNLAILGADAITPQGFYALDPNVSFVSHAMVRNAVERMVVADSSKFVTSAFARFATWDDIDILVTDDDLPRTVRRWLAAKAKRVIYVRAR